MTMSAENPSQQASAAAKEVLARRAESLALESVEEEVSDRMSMLLFRIGDEWYAVRVGDVREIFQEYDVTDVPCTPEYILGVTNVRGEILSVTDPALLVGLGRIVGTGEGQPPAIVVKNELVTTALVVDEIGDIVEVANESVEPPVSLMDRAQAEFVAGSVFVNDTMIGLLDVNRVLEPVDTSSRR
jgi:purine-binding chemotaxis protein CheW